MSLALVTLDLGNSGLKLRVWRERAGPGTRFERHAALDVALERLRDASAGPAAELRAELARFAGMRAALSSVASAADTTRLVELARSAGLLLESGLDSGVENLTRTPHTVGADRLFAARGAAELLGESCLVLDAGTALTVDAVVVAPDGSRGPCFLGGAIAPGPRLAARVLHTLTARLPDHPGRVGVFVDPDDDLLDAADIGGRLTAIQLGVSRHQLRVNAAPATLILVCAFLPMRVICPSAACMAVLASSSVTSVVPLVAAR